MPIKSAGAPPPERRGQKDDQDRPDRDFFGNNGDDRDPTRQTGIGFLDVADVAIQDAFSGTAGDDRITTPTERPGVRPPNDEERPPLRPPSEEEEPQIIPGDPSNLGARGQRRRGQNDSNASPVLRRGLLGV